MDVIVEKAVISLKINGEQFSTEVHLGEHIPDATISKVLGEIVAERVELDVAEVKKYGSVAAWLDQ